MRDVSVVPRAVHDPSLAAPVVKAEGAAVVTGVGTTAADAVALASAIFGARVLAVPEAAVVREGGERDRRPAGLDHTTRSPAHTDGYAYGDRYPDHILLVCAAACPEGGESFLVDGHALLDELAADEATAWVPPSLARVAVDQTEPGMQPALGPIVLVDREGHRMVRRTADQRPAPRSPDPARDAEMIAAWHGAVDEATEAGRRFRLEPGQAVVVDNYRLLHGREPYVDLRRQLWRVWVWTDRCRGLPDGLLHSDSRYASAG